jgi:hypothetical protein
MYHLQQEPRERYIFLYVNVESVEGSEPYFKLLFDTLLGSDVVVQSFKNSKTAKSVFDRMAERIKKIELFGVGVEIEGKQQGSYSDEFYDLMKNLKTDEFSIVMLVDEFPSTVENIRKKQGDQAAVMFLKTNRTMRQTASKGLQFVYTGSIGLPALVSRLDVPESINDLNQLEVPPLNLEEGGDFTMSLLESANIPFEPSVVGYFLERVRWLMPFFIQIGVQEIIEEYEISGRKIDNAAVDAAFLKVANRRNNIHFETYFNRLKDAFPQEDYPIAVQILSAIANVEQLPVNALFVSAVSEEDKRRIRYILDSLEYDGYICRTNGDFRFNSPILQRWWVRYVPKS